MTRRSPKRSSSSEQSAESSPDRSRAFWYVILISLVLGITARIIAILIAPQTSYLPDHISNMGWSTYAVQHGPWHVYDLPKNQPLVVRVRDRNGQPGQSVRLNAHACNYPPLSVYLFWLQGVVWHALDHDVITLQSPPRLARAFNLTQPVSSRVVDTRASRFADALPGIIFDFLLAWGVAMLVRALRPERRSRILEALAFSITILAPPIFLDSAFWNQADSWITCLLVWCLVFLMRQRLLVAGLIYGVAIMTKPQAILLVPLFVYVFLALRFVPGGTWRRALGLWKTGVVALLVVAFVAAPFMIADAGSAANSDGAFRWFKRSYLGTVGAESYQRTTLNAFNIWWLDMLSQGSPPPDRAGQQAFFRRLYSPDETLLGIRKGLLGRVLLGAGIVLAWLLCARKWRWAPQSWPACTFVILLAAFALPISVHERYIYYCIPFVIALACHEQKWIPPLIALLLVGTFEMTSFRWAGPQMIHLSESVARSASGLLALLTVLALLYSYAVLIPRAKDPSVGRPPVP
ncbi:MAG: hypothetical protein KKB50_05165 [Planctomycetes bacterium]|nr:hypothetical protein [Planctomycetota bacterium]